ncbi:unnamed protein product [Peronospora destructor]|uniref:Ricin B lectin domain-containing protein n=1 Tax=Peronospora destructor TaxID=86335 RepID=A0AAV0U3G6_9STRA|nr:unnamed protein product [Peronospora destructor]
MSSLGLSCFGAQWIKWGLLVHPSVYLFSEIFGFGGAFTEAASLQFQRLPHEKQEEVLKLYFDPRSGVVRTALAVCPWDRAISRLESYNFAEKVNDINLLEFDVDVTHDTKTMIPFIMRALELRPDIEIVSHALEPAGLDEAARRRLHPSMLGSVKPVGLQDDMRATWALYFSKFITAYKSYGISFWGLTPQNEPEFAAPWEACAFDPGDGAERYMDGVEYPEHLTDTHFVNQNRFILSSESCNCPGVAFGKDAWFRGLRYGHDILNDLNNYVVGWVDWNLLLDHSGGPNHKDNLCDAPIILTEDGDDFNIQPMFYFIQHFSKFIPVGSLRVKVQAAAHFEKPGDAQLYVGYQLSLDACDGSSRQMIHRTNDGKMQVTNTPFCVTMVLTQGQGQEIRLAECKYTQQTWTFEQDTQRIRIDDLCLSLRFGSTENGIRVTADKCEEQVQPFQQWTFNGEDGTMRSHASTSDQCMTTGYAFVQATAFVTPENRKVLVVLNENTEPADFQVQVGDAMLDTTILPGAIRTYIWK